MTGAIPRQESVGGVEVGRFIKLVIHTKSTSLPP